MNLIEYRNLLLLKGTLLSRLAVSLRIMNILSLGCQLKQMRDSFVTDFFLIQDLPWDATGRAGKRNTPDTNNG